MPLTSIQEACNYIASLLALLAICMLIYVAIVSLSNNYPFLRFPRRNPFMEEEISRRERTLLLSGKGQSFDDKQVETENAKRKEKELDSMDIGVDGGDQNYKQSYGAIAPLDDEEL